MITRLIFMFVVGLCSKNVYSEEFVTSPVSKVQPMSSGYVLQLILGLVVVVLCIIVLAWLAKKINRFQAVSDENFKIIGGISMGARERIVLLQVGREQLLVGVSPGTINMLHALDEPVETKDVGVDRSEDEGFSEKIKTIMANTDRSSEKK